MAQNTLGLTIEGAIKYGLFNKANGLFWGLIKALSGEIAPDTTLIWWPTDLHAENAMLTLGAQTSPNEFAERTVHAYAGVGTALALDSPIPHSPKVNRCALLLSQIIDGEVTALHFTSELGSVPVRQPVGLGNQRKRTQGWGTVDGTLETITSHRRLAFTLYESHFGYPVLCMARHDQEATMLQYWRKFVRVSGLIIRDAQRGHPLEIQQISDVEELQVSDPDSYKKAAGMLDLGEDTSEVLIRKLRDASA